MLRRKLAIIICTLFTITLNVAAVSAEELKFDSLRNVITNQSMPEDYTQKSYGNGWENDGGQWRYYESGIAQIGWQYINGAWYYFYDNGIMAHDTVINNCKMGSSGEWIK